MTLELNERSVWQVAAGTHDRTYADQFLNHGVALIGPGDPGPWDPKRSDEEFGGAFVRRFAVELCKGDILLLRTGPSTIRAVGLVACDYQYLPQFDDVNGWDLQHCRRVRWSELPEPHDFGCQVGNGSRLSRVYSETVVEYANRFVQSSPTDWQKCALPRLPQKEAILTAPPCYLEGLVAQVHDLVPRYWNSDAFAELPTEDELVAHYVVPFLRALGWPVKKIAVK